MRGYKLINFNSYIPFWVSGSTANDTCLSGMPHKHKKVQIHVEW